MTATTLVTLLRQRAHCQPGQRVYTFLTDGEKEEIHITYVELDQQARSVGALLQDAGVAAGERVLLLYPPGLEYIAAFFGCLYAGAIAVPCYPPRLDRPDPRLAAIVTDSQATTALTLTPMLSLLELCFAHAPALAGLRWITTDTLTSSLAETWRAPAIDSETVAFFQYTSGSTATPKGVMVSHGNLLHNQRMIQRAFETTEHTITVSWLPLYHDMGLIGNVLQPLYVGFHGILMSPLDFLQSPFRWLQAISHYKATHSGGPNFAYDLCVRKITPEQQATLDLSSWGLAYSGAEPVRHETLERFAKTFRSCGFRQEAFYPCYGLAEATLLVSGGRKSAPPISCAIRETDLERGQVLATTPDEKGSRIVVSCGQSDSDQKVVIVNPESLTRCPPNQVGEIWISGPSITQGYWNRPEETERTFRAHLDIGEGPFLRTGDLGFLKDGELFVTGRLKDLIIIRGRNLYPQDIELTVEQSHPALRPGCGAAFSIDEPIVSAVGQNVLAGEQLVVVQEVVRHAHHLDVEAVASKIRQAVAEQHEVQVYAVVLLKTGTIPKTSSGKIQRHACRAAYLAHNLEVIGNSILDAPCAAQSKERLSREALLAAKPEERRPLLEAYLLEEVARILRVAATRLIPQGSLSTWGLDSLMALELKGHIEADLSVSLPMTSFLHDAGIAHLVDQVLGQLMDGALALPPASSFPAIPPAPDKLHQPFPLTDVQQVYWIGRGEDFELGNVATHGYQEFDTVGLDLERFEQAWQRLIERHAMLRAIVRPDGQQQILEQVLPYCIKVSNLHGQHPETVAAQLEQTRQRMSHQVLPTDQWPLFEICASRLDDQRVRLHVSLDLLIGDAWSIQIMGRELVQLYQYPEKPLSSLELSFRDYVLAEMAWRDSELYRRSLEYWQSRMPTLPPAPELPLAASPRSLAYPRFVRREARIEPEKWLALKSRAAQAGLTPSGILLAAFAEVLTTWSQSPRFTINLTLFNRLPLHPQVNDIVGDFTSLTLLEVDNSAQEDFQRRAQRLQDQLWKDLDHRYVSGVRVLRELAQAQGGAPRVVMPIVFTSTLGLNSLHQESGGLNQFGEQVYGISQTPQVWLDHQVAEQGGALVFNWDAVQELFPEELLDDMFGAYCDLLQRLAGGEEAWQQTSLCLAPPSQLEQRATVNATSAPVSEELLHTLFAAQISERPNQAAVVTSRRTLTYEDVYRRSNRVGHWLRQRGARPNALVAVVMEKGWEQVVAVLGVLQSGAAYLPIDPELPQERVWYLLEHGQVELVLTQSWLDDKLAWPENVQRLRVDGGELEGVDDHPLTPMQRQEDLAYVIYTSGSTGLPKGVMIDHRGAVNTVLDINQRFGVGPADRVLALSSLSFDLSVYDIFGTLAAGGTIVIPDAWTKRDPAHWAEMVTRERVTIWNSVPALMEMLLEYLNGHSELEPSSLRLVMLSGDWIPVALPDQIKAVAKDSRVISLGGATEASVWSILYPIEQMDPAWKSIPYGWPMLNQSIHVLDGTLEPRPMWVPGQLYIGGIGLAKGYWRDEDKTRSRFITHPRTGERLYWTGDLGRYLPDGNIEFLGREDFQVKVQGYRIELGEIEAVLAQHPAVRTGVAAAVGEPRGSKRLVAYIIPNDGQVPTVDELRCLLRDKLPEYMVPSAFVFMEALPLTPNGKVDRKALPAPDEARLDSAQAHVAPRTSVEELLAGIWAEVLGLERVGIYDNFFELGGHSLSAAQVVSRVRQIFQVELPLRALFENTTVAGLAQNLERIRWAERGECIAPLAPVFRQSDLPLSFAQQRLWFLDQLEPGSALYNVPTGVRLSGNLNVAALEQSLNQVVQRHEALRTTFAAVDERLVQVIAPNLVLVLPVTDLRGKPENERDAEARRRAGEEARKPFDLARGPLVRAQLIQLDDTDYLLLLTMHHIISDGWSRGVLIRELASLYVAFATGHVPSLPELPIQYADYAVWQRQWLQGHMMEAGVAYWKERLAGVSALDLPTDRSRPAALTYRGAAERLDLAPNLTKALVALSRREGVTPFMTLLAAFQVLLMRYTNQTDIAVGSPVANRNRAEIEGLIGFFVNTFVLRTDLSGNPTFRELLGRVREVTLEAYAHQDVPFEQLVEELQPARDLSRTPLFQVMFVHHNFPAPNLELPGLSARPVEIDTGTSKFDLTWSIWEGEQSLEITAEYNTDLFDATTVQRLLVHWQVLLEGIVADPGRPVLTLPLLTEAERYKLGTAYNATDVDYTPESDLLLHELFEAQARRTPAAPAVITGDGVVLSYEELERRANQVAHQLHQHGVGPNVLVAVAMEKGWEQVVAVLGILKSGAAYLPIDPYLPQERRWYLLEYGQATLVLTQPQFMESLAWPETVQRILVDQESLMRLEASPLEPRFQGAQDLAYVIFTSGSTGLPKGVMIDHRGAVNTILDINRRFSVGPDDRVLAVSALNFDLSVYDIFGILAAGGAVVLPKAATELDPAHWTDLILQEKITVWNSVPALMEMLVRYTEGQPGLDMDVLRLVLLSGDWIPLTLPDQIKTLAETAVVISLGGATEASIWSIFYPIGAVQPGWRSIPYGRPLGNQHFYVLNEALELCPVRVPGQLYIGGLGLAKGYWRDDKQTRARFFSHPRTGERLYWTGDLGCYLPDENIEFLGRVDFQVKIQGHRIELGEIEAALEQHPAVRAAVASVVGERHDHKRLVAYVVPTVEIPAVDDLRSFLKGKLPKYMVPSAFMMLDRFPLTANGKVDRKALPAPNESGAELDEAYVAPHTPVEEILAGIWAEILGLEQVGIHDNFFELGGNSLLATQMVSRVRQTFQIELPLRSVFETPTIAGVAEGIETACWSKEDMLMPPMEPVSRENELALSFAQQRLWFLGQLEPDNPFYNIPAAVRLTGALDVAALEQSLNTVVERHEVLRTLFATVNGRPVQVVVPASATLLQVIDLQELSKAEREARILQLAMAEAGQPFDLAHGLLLRAILVRLDKEEHVLLLTMHHIVSDGWSIGILVQEMAALYNAFSNGKPSPLPELPIQYADFAVWQRKWLDGKVLEAQLSYWKERLDSCPPVLEMPTDRPRPAVQTFRGAIESFALSKGLTEALKELSQRERVTLFMTLLAAFKVLLYRYTGQEDIVVGSPIANRNRGEIERLIGFFVNTLVLRTDLGGNPSFQELLGRVREVALGAFAHQDLPFEYLVEELELERNLSRTPLFQVVFDLQSDPMQTLQLPGLTLSQLKVESRTAKFDLTLSMVGTAQGLVGSLEYNTDLFDAVTISRLAEHFQILLEGIVADPQQPIADLPLLPEVERRQLLVEWNNTRIEYPQDVCVHELFEAQAKRTPDAVAVVSESQHLTYRELNHRANQLAHYLRKRGVGPEVIVGICVDHSVAMVVGLLGILKAGGAYVPLDPTYPPARLAFMLEDTHSPVLLTQQHLVANLPNHLAQIVCLDKDWEAVAQESREHLDSKATVNNLAYVIYTSGSTGQPKGVRVEHRGLLNLIFWHQRAFAVSCADRATQVAGLAFDASVWELWPYLTAGASIHIPDEETRTLPVRLRDWLVAEGITISFLPTPLAEAILPLDWPRELALRVLLTGGEKLHCYPKPSLPFEVVNNYGPTENTVVTTSGRVSYKERAGVAPSIGRPISNVQVYLLDQHSQPVPIGVPGELCVGGDSLARDYLNRPDQTAEHFIPNPFSEEPGARLYKTGDLARYLPDGNIEFLGRIDHQVKIRGLRIELGEIETMLAQHPAVREVVVLARDAERAPGDKRLVAYVVSDEEQEFAVNEMRRFLQEKLPGYMVPSAFVSMPALPLTPNGKVDRRALPAPDGVRPELEGAFVAPRTPVEQMLAGIWAETLGLERVGVHDNFFDLGGDSILSIQIVARSSQVGLVFTPKQLFEHQTIAGLAQVVDTQPAVQTEQELVVGPVPLTPIQNWFFEQNLADPHHYNQALLLKVRHPLIPALLEQALQQLLVHHDGLRLRFEQTTSGWRQINTSLEKSVPFIWIDLSAFSEAEQTASIERTTAALQASLNLSTGPLVRVAHFDLGEEKPGCLFVVIHHLAVDGVSWRILLEDLETAYRQLSLGEAVHLPPKTTSFMRWAERLTGYAQSEKVAQELDNWLDKRWEMASTLPVDYPGGVNTMASAQTVSVSLSAQETQALLQEVPKVYRTEINDVLLTALAQAFAQWTGSNFLLVDLEGHGREEILEGVDLSRTVGWFTSISPVLLELEEGLELGDALKLVKEQLRRIPERGINYGVLRYLSRDARIVEKLEAIPRPEVSFNYLGQLDQILSRSLLFEIAPETNGSHRSPRGTRRHLLEVNGQISGGQLQLTWTYSKDLHCRSTVEGVAQAFRAALRSLIAHCQSLEAECFTPSDFPEAGLGQEELDDLIAEFSEARVGAWT